jgi:hypothetical protein
MNAFTDVNVSLAGDAASRLHESSLISEGGEALTPASALNGGAPGVCVFVCLCSVCVSVEFMLGLFCP